MKNYLLITLILFSLSSCFLNKALSFKIGKKHFPEGLESTTLIFYEIDVAVKKKKHKKLLIERNTELHEIMAKNYDYDFLIPNKNNKDLLREIDENKEKYRFELRRREYLRTFYDPEGKSRQYKTFVYHFYDRKLDKAYPDIEEFSSVFWEVFKVIIHRANKLTAKRVNDSQ